jgi:hypothetical protein
MTLGILLSVMLALFASLERVNHPEADRWFSQARQHFEKRQWEQSRAAARKALESDPQFAAAAKESLGSTAIEAVPLVFSCHGSGKRRALGWTKHCPLCAGRGWQNTKIITPIPAP